MSADRIAGLLVLDDRGSQICARQVDVIVPGTWDKDRCMWEAARRLPAKMALADDNPALVVWYPLDEDPVFADWRTPSKGQPLFKQEPLFEAAA